MGICENGVVVLLNVDLGVGLQNYKVFVTLCLNIWATTNFSKEVASFAIPMSNV